MGGDIFENLQTGGLPYNPTISFQRVYIYIPINFGLYLHYYKNKEIFNDT